MTEQEFSNGIDVSHHNGIIDWKKVKVSGIHYAMIKATDSVNGQIWRDPMFSTNWKKAKEAEISVGAYHYFRALANTPDEQITGISQQLLENNFALTKDLLAIDVEETGNKEATRDQMADNLNLLLQGLARKGFLHLLIYCSPSYWENKVAWEKYDFSCYSLWIAHWQITQPKIPTTWKNKGWRWWQTTNKGNVDGISGDVDLNKVNLSLSKKSELETVTDFQNSNSSEPLSFSI
jgi:lysozyme